jgi:hypothetical protein
MYRAFEQTQHPVSKAAFLELELAATVAPADNLARRRAAWLDQRPQDERIGFGVPSAYVEADSVRYWVLPV